MSSNPITTPVVLIVYNRPQHTQRVLEAIERSKPSKLYLIGDGPRSGDVSDEKNVAETRKICESVSWECEVFSNFADSNLGCSSRVVSGLNWVFEQEEEVIILEDDCLPHFSFFDYCQNLLNHFRNDTRIFAIRGTEYPAPVPWTKYSYYFSKHFIPWGWATWRQAWELHDSEMSQWAHFESAGGVESVLDDVAGEAEFLSQVMRNQSRGHVEVHWDWGFQSTVWAQNGLIVAPRKNLISNIGFGSEASHLQDGGDVRAGLRTTDIGNISHPPCVVRNKQADIYRFRYDHQFEREKETGPNAVDPIPELEARILHLESQLEAKEEIIQNQHQDLLRLQGVER